MDAYALFLYGQCRRGTAIMLIVMPFALDPFRFVLIALSSWITGHQLLLISYLREENRVPKCPETRMVLNGHFPIRPMPRFG